MNRTLIALTIISVGTIGAAACGGRAALEAYELGDGAGAASSGGNDSTTSGSDTSTDTSTSTSTSTSTTTTTTTTPTPSCDLSGSCDLCADCAFNGPCAQIWEACFQSQPCLAFMDCLDMCSGGMCFPQCMQNNPQGGQQYLGALQCVLCDQCAMDCDGAVPPMLCDF